MEVKVSYKKYLVMSMGKSKYRSLPKDFREKIDRLDKLPPAPKPVTFERLNEALR